MGNPLGILLLFLPFLGLLVAVLLVVYGALALVVGLRRPSPPRAGEAPSAPKPQPSQAKTALAIGGFLGLGVALLIGAFSATFISQIGRSVLSSNKAKGQENAMRANLGAIGAAQAAYRSANGGFYGTPACLARPAACIPGYSGPPFLDPELASLKPQNGYSMTFYPGPPAPSTPGSSASSLTGYAVKAVSTEFTKGEATAGCVDARIQPCYNLREEEPIRGVCPCRLAETGVYPLVIEFGHEPGKSACPRPIGSVLVFNGTRRTITTDIRTATPAPLWFGPNVSLEPLESKSIEISYTCLGRDDFTAEVLVLRPEDTSEANAFESKLTVYGTVVR